MTTRWSDLTTRQRRAVVLVGAAEVVLTTAALTSLARTPSTRLRGPKAAWIAGCFVQPVGPLAYFLVGRR
ncbi:PLD nuclease N-terminal domain-containing protein [Mumia sp. zg.B53]|uniref:PLD nuclease N-terminal domain-containing protein n=1 Tax=unclassified Mumia TaxID=2621872 RepID=UPI001C6F0482|nr:MULTISPECIES: PLD nuclease N-terminal domain-containing protein [unclassified Mumia]MBW9207661.1 PLD nuclease N-terminal domain-containing protein [Mumia sp. zg.B17]MBW9214596.1 PLD nuclease N-terminal domain-containing protein [Mumia sp. zg.B53]MDD9347797.1 PLD nuclease N-terminal domain-containing protein [Mumia sp.]